MCTKLFPDFYLTEGKHFATGSMTHYANLLFRKELIFFHFVNEHFLYTSNIQARRERKDFLFNRKH
jgi:hypothetical protein